MCVPPPPPPIIIIIWSFKNIHHNESINNNNRPDDLKWWIIFNFFFKKKMINNPLGFVMIENFLRFIHGKHVKFVNFFSDNLNNNFVQRLKCIVVIHSFVLPFKSIQFIQPVHFFSINIYFAVNNKLTLAKKHIMFYIVLWSGFCDFVTSIYILFQYILLFTNFVSKMLQFPIQCQYLTCCEYYNNNNIRSI